VTAARYLASYAWPVPPKLVERRGDGITYYNKSRAVDEPLITTSSADGAWIVTSFDLYLTTSIPSISVIFDSKSNEITR
jgi:hypothetical protein